MGGYRFGYTYPYGYEPRRLFSSYISFCISLSISIIHFSISLSTSQPLLFIIFTMFSARLYTLVFLAVGIAVEAVPAPYVLFFDALSLTVLTLA